MHTLSTPLLPSTGSCCSRVATGGSVEEGRGPCAQYSSRTPDTLISIVSGRSRFDLKKVEQLLCLKSFSEMNWPQGHHWQDPYILVTEPEQHERT